VLNLIGRKPDGLQDFVCATTGDKKGDYIIHSVTTTDYTCGAFLYDSNRDVAVGLHTRTDGPNPNGSNNYAASFF
jgi:hypothetical protein